MIGVIGKDVWCTARSQERLYRRYRGLYRRYRGGLCMAVQPAMQMSRQTNSIMCMDMCTRGQNEFAERGNELKQALFDRRLWKELDLLQSVRQGKAKILKFAGNGHEPESKPFLSFMANDSSSSRTDILLRKCFSMTLSKSWDWGKLLM
jgi:hypothetical protein